jgi:hypothetical protein
MRRSTVLSLPLQLVFPGQAKDKSSSLFGVFVGDDEECIFITLTPGVNVIKLYFFIADYKAK